MSFEDHLTTAMRSSAATLDPPVTDLATRGVARGRQLRRRRFAIGVGAVVALAAVTGVGGYQAWEARQPVNRDVVTATGDCAPPRSDVLPTWARDGFSDPEPRVPHVMSEDGRMVAILFGPLQAPSAEDRNNKVLWVSRPDSAGYPLDIAAVRAGSDGTVVRRHLGGPGPSIVDLPQPGCWTLHLHWGEFRDTIDLEYARP